MDMLMKISSSKTFADEQFQYDYKLVEDTET